MTARIYLPAKSAMTSGVGQAQDWVLEYEPGEQRVIDPLMGWTGSGDMQGQVKLRFETKDAAIAYATKHGLAYSVQDATPRRQNIRPQGYGGNYAYNRRQAWTH